MNSIFSVTLLDQFREALANPIPLDQVLDTISMRDLWRCDEFIF